MSVKILTGDCRDVLKTLADQSVNCIVTSPPYYGLRDYGTATWEGGDADCDHELVNARRLPRANEVKGAATADGGKNGTGYAMMAKEAGGECAKCGALRVDRQIGLEETPDQFVAALVDVFREARRVLRDDGVAFINIGDSYAGNWGAQGHRESSTNDQRTSKYQIANHPKKGNNTGSFRSEGLKHKDLIGIPWMLAFALRADGWYLRQDIIWAKPNPMPESVTDRCTKSHEHVFLLSKSARYYFDAGAIAEPVSPASVARLSQDVENQIGSDRVPGKTNGNMKAVGGRETRNKRDVWTIATEPSSIAHYAMMPTELARTCILAGCSVDGVVLDPFGGAGTTGMVADRLRRNAVLIELGADHAATAQRRVAEDAGMFA